MSPRTKKLIALVFSLFTGVLLLTNIGSVGASRASGGHESRPNETNKPGGEGVGSCSNPAVVTTTADSGVGSLREAFTSVCAGGTITFDPALTSGGPATIHLLSALPTSPSTRARSMPLVKSVTQE